MSGLRYPSHGRSRQSGHPARPSAEGRSCWLNLLRKILSFSIPNRFYPGTLCPHEPTVGLFPDGGDINSFQQPSEELVRQLSLPTIPDIVKVGAAEYPIYNQKSERGWLRLEHIVQHRPPYPPTDHSYFARTVLHSDIDRKATLRLAFDDWATVWLNGKQVATLDHAAGFDTALLPVALIQGDNQLVIKTNNRQNTDRLIWVLNCAWTEN